ncbi:barstar family protein [Pseudonocardia phyllosphaerae]|uniref:barstar family protein n=1 Tax=Pseudonocardia phyllosphaerae TaxID=3390502 RepID=UPI003977FC13
MTDLPRDPAGTAHAVEAVRERVGSAGLVGVVEKAADRAAFLTAVGRALSFPSWYGENLDALEDCLKDLSWLPEQPVALVWEDGPLAAAEPVTHEALLEILGDAVAGHRGTDRPLEVTLAGPA